MLGFWEDKLRNRMVARYSFAPILEEAGILLIGASRLWHEWSIKRAKELRGIGYSLKDRAKEVRKSGLSWASNISEFGEDPAHLLHSSAHRRYHGDDKKTIVCPEATIHMVSIATELLFLLIPFLKKIEEEHYEEKWLDWIYEKIEILMESPCIGPVLEIPQHASSMLILHSALLECEGLAITQAKIEDHYARENKQRKKKKSELSDDELRKLAFDIGVSFEEIKEIFETEYSSWWEVGKKYRGEAEAVKKNFVSLLKTGVEAKNAILVEWDPGMVTDDVDPKPMFEKEVEKSEKIIKMFIAIFLSGKTRKIEANYKKIGKQLNPA